jgi:hypothetical protein
LFPPVCFGVFQGFPQNSSRGLSDVVKHIIVHFSWTLQYPQDMMIVCACIRFEFPLVTSFFVLQMFPLPLLYRWHWSEKWPLSLSWLLSTKGSVGCVDFITPE